MNNEKVLELADIIEQSEDFHMDDCSRCIAGHMVAMYCIPVTSSHESLMHGLDIDAEMAHELFAPCNNFADWSAVRGDDDYVSQTRAVKVLRNLAETEMVDWSEV